MRIKARGMSTGKLGGRIRIRIMRPWRGYPVGAVIEPPGGMRQVLLQAHDQLGNKVAEVIDEEIVSAPVELAEPEIEEAAEVEEDEGEAKVSRGPGRPRKGEAK